MAAATRGGRLPHLPALLLDQPARDRAAGAARNSDRDHRRAGRRTRASTRTSGRSTASRSTAWAGKTPRSRVSFDYADESDHVRYPIPHDVHIEAGGGDRHGLLVDRRRCRLYELYALERQRLAAGTPARARRGTCAPRSCGRRAGRRPTPPGLPIFPLLARWARPRGADPPRAARHLRRARATPTSTRRATPPRRTATRRCRAWASGCG